MAIVANNKNDKIREMPKATKYWCQNFLFTSTCFDDSKPPRIPFNPLAIRNIDNINPVESKPECLLFKMSLIIICIASYVFGGTLY